MMNQKAQAEVREAEKKALISSLPHPYAKEIDSCDHLIGYITQQ